MTAGVPRRQSCASLDGVVRDVVTTLERDAHARVRDGMELIAWEYALSSWRWHLHYCGLPGSASSAPPRVSTPRRTLAIVVTGATLGAVVGAAVAPVGLGVSLAAAGTALGGLVSAALEAATGGIRSRQIHERLDATEPPRVLLTSTGILFGDVARLWSGKRSRLRHVELRSGEPTYLILDFDTSAPMHVAVDARAPLCIPVPDEVVGDVAEIARMLALRCEGGAKGPNPDELVRRGGGEAD